MFSILICLILLMFLAYKGYSILWVAPVCGIILATMQGLDVLPAYTTTYMEGFVGFTKSWFPTFMLGAIFGRIMEDSGAAKSIANAIIGKLGHKFAIASVVISCGFMAYGGISIFVVIFAIYPLSLAVFKEANITRKLIPGALALGSFTFAMSALPGTPQIQNLIPTKYFGTTAMAAPTLGIVSSLIMFLGGYFWLSYRAKKASLRGEGFDSIGIHMDKENSPKNEKHVNVFLACIPLVTVIVLLNILELNVIVALSAGSVVGIIVGFNNLKGKIIHSINKGAANSVTAIINTSAAVGFGAVVKAVPAFTEVSGAVIGMKGNPLISLSLAVNLLAGATGSASGGLGIALEALSSKYIELAKISNISLEVFHRVASVSSGGLDSLPHNGAILTVLALCSLTHKDSYFDMFMVATVIPVLSVVAIIILGGLGIC